jgi:hypothetical protein
MVLPALEDKYLGTRITAWGVIRELILAEADFDPWASRAQRTDAVEKLRAYILQQDARKRSQRPDPEPD